MPVLRREIRELRPLYKSSLTRSPCRRWGSLSAKTLASINQGRRLATWEPPRVKPVLFSWEVLLLSVGGCPLPPAAAAIAIVWKMAYSLALGSYIEWARFHGRLEVETLSKLSGWLLWELGVWAKCWFNWELSADEGPLASNFSRTLLRLCC